mmetsp:Transcript_2794/g.5757  ORF Transcript_2794/g.5757 Transcript_2794/m.5757 type:complete len:143 (-) Transcript_2794:9-437(-)
MSQARIAPFPILLATTCAIGFTRAFYSVTSVSGHSMSPTIRSGDWVIVNRSRWDQCELGDIVVCHQITSFPSSKSIIKRVTSISPDNKLFLSSDNVTQKFEDSTVFGRVNRNVVKGVVIGRIDKDWNVEWEMKRKVDNTGMS